MKTLPISTPESLLPHFSKPTHRLFYALGLKTGFRVSELLSLRVRDVFHPSGEVLSLVTVERRNMKGKRSSRSVPLSAQSKEFIRTQATPDLSSPDAHLFQFGRRAANLFLDVARIKAGSETRVACHSMRKTFAKRVFDVSGRDLTITQKLMGHSSINSTVQYL